MRDKAVESACVVIGLMQGGQQGVRRYANICSLCELIGGACELFVRVHDVLKTCYVQQFTWCTVRL